MELSERQKAIYEFIRDYDHRYGLTPQTIEIQKHFGYRANSTVHHHLKALQKKGYIDLLHKQKRSIVLCSRPWARATFQKLGIVPAGQMVEVFETYEEVVLPDCLLKRPQDTFTLEVRGESMIDAGIQSGDLVFIERRPTARNGQIVVATYEGQMTLKRFFREKDHIRLQPENRAMEAIRIYGELEIVGVMVGLLRSTDA